MHTDLSTYNNSWFQPGSFLKRTTWHYINCFFFKSGYFPFYSLKTFFLRLFGAKVGQGVMIKPFVNIKYPWMLSIGNHVWIGENAWIDNIALIRIEDNVCISQGASLLTGNHNYKKKGFDLQTGEIVLEQGVWIGAQAIVCPGITCKVHSVLLVGSVATTSLDSLGVYRGNP
ncbi:MAG: Transferase hexapeptide repeat containing protein, partial [Ferruginibacter sp.]|nr:Transferase hexapeptide repeat containing protein [Ferruginibacter sp.]